MPPGTESQQPGYAACPRRTGSGTMISWRHSVGKAGASEKPGLIEAMDKAWGCEQLDELGVYKVMVGGLCSLPCHTTKALLVNQPRNLEAVSFKLWGMKSVMIRGLWNQFSESEPILSQAGFPRKQTLRQS